ncbi:MAG: FAD-dependent oxidoreductase [Tissierellia bacterium]|nr:FAD-dependent oxidoreductase [Tissierellia bacterium]
MEVKYAIIGSGVAGHTAAKEIRKHDGEGSIVILGREHERPYYRISLTETLGAPETDNRYLVAEDWYEKEGIELKTDALVDALDFEERTIHLSTGELIHFESLLLATGAHSFIPPIEGADKEGVFALRSYDDLLEIRQYLEHANRVAVIGGGVLGIEAANSLKALDKDVCIVESFDYVLGRQLDREMGLECNEKLHDMGFDVHVGIQTASIDGDEKVTGITFADGSTMEVDAVLISAGVRPTLDLVKDSPLKVERGIVVNEHLETNVPGVYAAGDVAQINGQTMGLWTAAMEMGKVVGAQMAGDKSATYEVPKLFTRLKMKNLQIFSAGDVSNFQEAYGYDNEETGEKHRIYLTDGVITGGVLTGNLSKMNALKGLVFDHKSLEDARELYDFKACEVKN